MAKVPRVQTTRAQTSSAAAGKRFQDTGVFFPPRPRGIIRSGCYERLVRRDRSFSPLIYRVLKPLVEPRLFVKFIMGQGIEHTDGLFKTFATS
ncbi:MAG: hypothetical protein ACI9W2_000995 [Gammaproteobacteria bacterium]|jgi:hypothetical protein